MLNNKTHNRLKLQAKGVLAVAQWDWRCLCSTRMQVRSPAWHSELKDLVMPPLWRRSKQWLGFDLWPGNSICHHGVVKRNKQTKNWVRDLNRQGDTQMARKQTKRYSTSPIIRGMQIKPKCQIPSHTIRMAAVKKEKWGVPIMVQRKQIRLGTMRLQVPSLASLSGLRIQHCCELWCRPVAVAPIRPLAWEPPYAASTALKRQKIKKKRKSVGEGMERPEPLCTVAGNIKQYSHYWKTAWQFPPN